MRRSTEAAAWLVGCASAGVGAMALARATAPAQTDGDWFDSDLFLPLTVCVALVTMAAGFRVPRLALLFGAAAGVVYMAAPLGIGFGQTPEQEYFMLAAVAFTLPFAVLPIVSAELGSYLCRRRAPGRGARTPSS